MDELLEPISMIFLMQEGYQDLIKQIASSATFSVTGAPAGGSSTASAAAAGR